MLQPGRGTGRKEAGEVSGNPGTGGGGQVDGAVEGVFYTKSSGKDGA